jgi:hypothetical protein
MNEHQDLPILDVSEFQTYQRDGEPFRALDQQSEEEDTRLQQLLGIPSLVEAQSEEALEAVAQPKPKGMGQVQISGRLIPVGMTPGGEIIAVALQLAVADHKREGKLRQVWTETATQRSWPVRRESYLE